MSEGVNGLTGVTVLNAANDDDDVFNTIDGSVPEGSDGKVLQQQLGGDLAKGASYSLTWTAQ